MATKQEFTDWPLPMIIAARWRRIRYPGESIPSFKMYLLDKAAEFDYRKPDGKAHAPMTLHCDYHAIFDPDAEKAAKVKERDPSRKVRRERYINSGLRDKVEAILEA